MSASRKNIELGSQPKIEEMPFKKDIELNLSLENINTILMALGQLQYNQVYNLVDKIRIQTESNLERNGLTLQK